MKEELFAEINHERLGQDKIENVYTINYDLDSENHYKNRSDLEELLEEIGNYTPSILKSFGVLKTRFYSHQILSLISKLDSFSKEDKYIIFDFTSKSVMSKGNILDAHLKILQKIF